MENGNRILSLEEVFNSNHQNQMDAISQMESIYCDIKIPNTLGGRNELQ